MKSTEVLSICIDDMTTIRYNKSIGSDLYVIYKQAKATKGIIYYESYERNQNQMDNDKHGNIERGQIFSYEKSGL